MTSKEIVERAKEISLAPLRKPLAKGAIRFIFTVPYIVLLLDAARRPPSPEVLAFLESVIKTVIWPVLFYVISSSAEEIAKLIKKFKEGHGEQEDIDDSHHYSRTAGGGSMDDSFSRAPRPEGSDRGHP